MNFAGVMFLVYLMGKNLLTVSVQTTYAMTKVGPARELLTARPRYERSREMNGRILVDLTEWNLLCAVPSLVQN